MESGDQSGLVWCCYEVDGNESNVEMTHSLRDVSMESAMNGWIITCKTVSSEMPFVGLQLYIRNGAHSKRYIVVIVVIAVVVYLPWL